MNQDLAKACEAMIKKGSATFYNAFRHLPSPKKEAVFVIYSFCRMIDDAVDEPEHSSYSIDEIEALFADLENADGHFIWPSLRWLFEVFPVSKDPFYLQIKGQRLDIVHTPFRSMEELETYCYHVAGSVGEMLLPVLHNRPSENVRLSGIALGKAMQIVNIIRDVGEDQTRGRRYIPEILMEKHGYRQDHFDDKKINVMFIELLNEMMDLAEKWFTEGLKDLHSYPEESAICIDLASAYYEAILCVVKENHYDVFRKRAIVSREKKKQIFKSIMKRHQKPVKRRVFT
jgi:phytoene synthase